MKIDLLCHIDVLRAKNHPNVAIQFANAFAGQGCNIELVVPSVHRNDNLKRKDVFSAYGLANKFKITYLMTFPFRDWSRLVFNICLVFAHFIRSFTLFLRSILSIEQGERYVIATDNDILIPYVLLSRVFKSDRIKTIAWEHEFHRKRRDRWVYDNSHGIIATNSVIRDDLIRDYDVPCNKVVLSFNPVASARFKQKLDKKSIRKKLYLDGRTSIVVYTGKLGVGLKEVEYILEAAAFAPNCTFILTGGVPKAVEYYRNLMAQKNISNVFLTGFIYHYDNIKYYQQAADVLVCYYSKSDINVRHNLPAKICEYMSSLNPIVTCDYPAIHDLLDDDCALFIEPENPKSLAGGIKKLIENKVLAKRLAENAFKRVQEITYEKRAKVILDFIKTL